MNKVFVLPIGNISSYSDSDKDSDTDTELELKTKMKKYIRFGFHRVYLFFVFLMNTFLKLFVENKKEKPIVITTEMVLKEYEEKEYNKFLKLFENDHANLNMNKEFYDIELYKNTVLNTDNEFEKQWKSRILYENTPRGNITMYYDAFKKGFAYYADQTSIPYKLLNTVAMKYVRIFSCRDLFIDDKYTPENYQSPLIKIQEEEEKKEKERIKSELGESGVKKEILKNGPFAKLKKYRLEDPKKDNEKMNKDKTINLISNVNKFLYMGKIMNFSFIQKMPVKRILKVENSYFKNLFDREHELQKDVLNYKNFKKIWKKD